VTLGGMSKREGQTRGVDDRRKGKVLKEKTERERGREQGPRREHKGAGRGHRPSMIIERNNGTNKGLGGIKVKILKIHKEEGGTEIKKEETYLPGLHEEEGPS